ncbi:hypothetical protein FRC04_007469 [Tulasnella sp. 424]|nr:hypothetical protein FRC04_007469 [Tulasnella sp. 424]KAG8975154.1 hypothetical protein FRC05_006322 [Tulasnella sp. 425]
MADPGVPVFRGGSGSDCEEFVRAVYTYAFEKDKTEDDKWMASYAATRLSGKALRWYARQNNSVKMDWSALQVALLDQYPPPDDENDVGLNTQLPPGTIPTPAAATAPAAGVATGAAGPAPIFLPGSQITIFGCNKARIRVEDKDGTVKGWMSTALGPFRSHLTSSSDNALHVKAYIVNTGGTELRVLNVDGWSRLCVRWSAATFDPDNRNQ